MSTKYAIRLPINGLFYHYSSARDLEGAELFDSIHAADRVRANCNDVWVRQAQIVKVREVCAFTVIGREVLED